MRSAQRLFSSIGVAVASAVFATGCDLDPLDDDLDLDFRDGTLGQEARVFFAYAEGCGLVLFQGHLCQVNEPILAGATTEIAVWGHQTDTLPPFRASTTDESILRVEQSVEPPLDAAAQLTVSGLAPGSAAIELVGDDGDLVDRITVEVGVAERLSLAIPDTRRVLLAGSRVSLPVVAHSADGRNLHGRGAIVFAAGGGLEPLSDYPASVDRFFAGTDHAVYRATGLGEVTVTATSGELAAADAIEVVGADAVASIALVPDETIAEDDEAALLVFPADAGGRPIYGAHCTWSVDATANVVLKLYFPDELVPRWFGDAELVVAAAREPGSARLTCTIGAVSATAEVSFPGPRPLP